MDALLCRIPWSDSRLEEILRLVVSLIRQIVDRDAEFYPATNLLSYAQIDYIQTAGADTRIQRIKPVVTRVAISYRSAEALQIAKGQCGIRYDVRCAIDVFARQSRAKESV